MSNSTAVAKIDPASLKPSPPAGESYNQNKVWTDDVMYIVLFYNSPLDVTTQVSPYQPARLYVWNLVENIALSDVTIAINLDQSGEGKQFWEDNLKNPDRPNGDTRTVPIGTMAPGVPSTVKFDWQVEHIANTPGNIAFGENLGITPSYSINYSNFPFNSATVAVNPNVSST